jgi:hypothetical protein
MEWSASRPCRFTSGEIDPGTYCVGGWVGPRAVLDVMEKTQILPLLGIEPQLLDHPAQLPLEFCNC